MKKCLYCGNLVKNKYCNTSCQNKHQNPTRKKERYLLSKNCEKCDKIFTQQMINKGKNYEKKFCSLECANSRIQNDKINKSRSIKLLKEREIRKCGYCDSKFEVLSSSKKIYCSVHCSRKSNQFSKDDCVKGGLKSSETQSKKRRSKNEILFANLCINYFKSVDTNKQIFNGWDADVIINDIKTAVLWNGKWHYEKITESHSVKQVQNRDKIKIKEIKKFGYKPYIIKDMGKYDPNFVEKEFKKFIKNISRGA